MKTLVRCVGFALVSFPLLAIQPPKTDHKIRLDRPAAGEAFEVLPSITSHRGEDLLRDGIDDARFPGLRRFLERRGAEWTIDWDERSDRPNLVQGRGIALLPGDGNDLRKEQVGLPRDRAVLL